MPGRKPHSRKSEKRKERKKEKKKKEKEKKKAKKSGGKKGRSGGVLKKPGWWPGKKGEKAVDSTTRCELSV